MSSRTAKIDGSGVSNFVDVKGLTRDRPWLLPSVCFGPCPARIFGAYGISQKNRKLRHLQGISLRNLTLSRPSSQNPGKAIDDESLPTAFKTPTKLLAQREKRLEHSRSSGDLNTTPKSKGILNGVPKEESDSDAFERPKVSKLKHRRRSTINWSNAPPLARQKKLEDVAEERMADTWFSLHCPGTAEPVYISEVITKAMNPSFRFFDLNAYGPFITRQDEFTIKYWARSESMEQYNLIIELKVHLRSLQFIGKSVRIPWMLLEQEADGNSWKTFTIRCHRTVSFST